nr:curli-like amyloid fiber formation chaperone CsgH [uncultured Gellertiella sp.]
MPIPLVEPPMQCLIEPAAKGSLTMLSATVSGTVPGAHYQFEIRTSDPGGSSSTNLQAGDVSATTGEKQVLGTVALQIAVPNWSARLIIYTPDGTTLCTTQLP